MLFQLLVGLPGRLALRLLVFLCRFPLFLVGLVQELLLVLNFFLGLALILFGTDPLGLNGHHGSEGDQGKEEGGAFHSFSVRKHCENVTPKFGVRRHRGITSVMNVGMGGSCVVVAEVMQT